MNITRQNKLDQIASLLILNNKIEEENEFLRTQVATLSTERYVLQAHNDRLTSYLLNRGNK